MMRCPTMSGIIVLCFSASAKKWAARSQHTSPLNATAFAVHNAKSTENNSSGSSRGSPNASACSIKERARSTAAFVSGAA